MELPSTGNNLPAILLIGAALGVTLAHGSYGFAYSWRALFVRRDGSGAMANLLMLAAATILFAPILAKGAIFGHSVSGAIAPADVSVAVGSFLFGVGMQMSGACASGCLYTAGGGNLRTLTAMIFFCFGAFAATFQLPWWLSLPSLGAHSFGAMMGWGYAAVFQISGLGILALLLRRFAPPASPLMRAWLPTGASWVRGPWPLPFAALMLAGLNWLTLLVAGHPWSIVWGYTLWGAKGARLLGWVPPLHGFWSWPFPRAALAHSILADQTSVMNIGIILGALLATAISGRFSLTARFDPLPLLSAALGGIVMGYGARLAFGCNIGSLFSGIASTSLHGWEWLVFALLGTPVGIVIRRRFGLPD
ncbi:YeeE/YedE family protein [Acidiphilium acidophilum]|uniref:YeeE/YedE family protein n=1 Tax=Acidiphilium acidophilum TaxID=76588 RepID=UPI002E8E73A9|nr:YeeE/YedE family protein [Acidiphilium acidophilum]